MPRRKKKTESPVPCASNFEVGNCIHGCNQGEGHDGDHACDCGDSWDDSESADGEEGEDEEGEE
jgi:hypothetical protein